MTNDHMNGAQLLLDEIDAELENKRMSKRDRLHLRSTQYILKSLVPIREDVHQLKKHDAIAWVRSNPRSAWLLGIGVLSVNSMVNWEIIRRPVLQTIIHVVTGIVVPINSLP